MDETVNCWNRFARKSLICFTGYYERFSGISNELNRIGMKDVNVRWDFPNPFEGVLLKNLKHEKDIASGGYMNCTMGHYSEIKTAFELGAETCLIMEDDIRFLKDVEEIDRIVNSLPEDFDIAMFDYFPTRGTSHGKLDSMKTSRKVNEYWAEFDDMYSMGCYALSRRAMERYIWLNEAAVLDGKVGMLRICDHFLDRKYYKKGSKLYFARENVAIQRGSNSSNTSFWRIARSYSRMGIDMSRYSE